MSSAPPKLVSAMWNRVPEPLRRRLHSSGGRRLLRFAPAAVLALAATQITYFICVSVVHSTGRVSGFAGWLAGAVVSYAVSRWAWERRGRPQLLRETLPFVVVSLVVGAVLTEVSHFAYQAAQTIGLHGIEFSLFVQGLYIAANAVTFVIRFLIFNRLIFADRAATRPVS
jgi:putative flippase GtrA